MIPESAHEQVTFCHDPVTGLRAIVAIWSTALGPALGGTRFHPYPSSAAALDDVLELSRAMAYKNALAGLAHGGGKAVIIGDPSTDKSAPLLRAYGRFVQGLGGRYITACDVGTYVADMDVIAETCDFVTGRSPERGGAGDSACSRRTASTKACAPRHDTAGAPHRSKASASASPASARSDATSPSSPSPMAPRSS